MYVIKSTNNLIITATNNNMIKRYYIFILINEFIKKKKIGISHKTQMLPIQLLQYYKNIKQLFYTLKKCILIPKRGSIQILDQIIQSIH